jgi:hypothetical protein
MKNNFLNKNDNFLLNQFFWQKKIIFLWFKFIFSQNL